MTNEENNEYGRKFFLECIEMGHFQTAPETRGIMPAPTGNIEPEPEHYIAALYLLAQKLPKGKADRKAINKKLHALRNQLEEATKEMVKLLSASELMKIQFEQDILEGWSDDNKRELKEWLNQGEFDWDRPYTNPVY